MSWTLLVTLVLVLGLALLAALARRAELARMASTVDDRQRAARAGADKARLQHPVVDLSRCLGCGTCVAACPEDGVLALVHGQALVVNGARCVGVSACERECPVGAITVTLGDTRERADIPALDESLEAVGSPGLFLAGEVTAHALIKTAIDHGTAVAAEVARRVQAARDDAESPAQDTLDLVIVGNGPAGLAASLEASRRGLRFVTLDREETIGGTVAKYPRAKLVLTQPLELPGVGRFRAASWTKEELIELWERTATDARLPLRGGEELQSVERLADGTFAVRTTNGTWRSRFVCLALGRRGTPRKLGVPGEDLPKVAYGLLDAHGVTGKKIVVVGGGDSAVETALGLAGQPGNEVTLAYRGEEFFRLRSRNEAMLRKATESGRLQVLLRSEIVSVDERHIELAVASGSRIERIRLANDLVYVMIGGTPPFELLERCGVSFDPRLRRNSTQEIVEQGTGLVQALSIALVLALLALSFALWHLDYYGLERLARPTHPKHHGLRPGMGLGLWLGIASLGLIAGNLLYLVRRSPRTRFVLGSLRGWMTSHVATGILAFLCALLHSAMAPRNTVGGHAFWLLAGLLVTGAIGRYLYAWVPRAANGRELELAEVKARIGRIAEEWDQGQRLFRERARAAIEALVERRQWRSSFASRLLALAGARRDIGRLVAELSADGKAQGVSAAQIVETTSLARRAHRLALMAAHYEDLRALLNAWRWLHRWGAALLVVLVVVHVIYALTYGEISLRQPGAGLS